MTIRCMIETGEPIARMKAVFSTELERTHERSQVSLREEQGKGVFHIDAQDIASLRASINSVMSVLSVYGTVTHDL